MPWTQMTRLAVRVPDLMHPFRAVALARARSDHLLLGTKWGFLIAGMGSGREAAMSRRSAPDRRAGPDRIRGSRFRVRSPRTLGQKSTYAWAMALTPRGGSQGQHSAIRIGVSTALDWTPR